MTSKISASNASTSPGHGDIRAGVTLSRRAFLAGLPLAAIVASCRRPPYRKEEFVLPASSRVALLPASGYGVDFADIIGRGLALFDLRVHGRRVFLKPNLVQCEAGSLLNSDPQVVDDAVAAYSDAGARDVVGGERRGFRRAIEDLLPATGLSGVRADLG